MKIILLGYMGSGKSSVGKSLSRVINVPFFDLDAVIEEKLKMSISEIFKVKGEIYFRKTEEEILKELLKKNQKMIVALGGGTPCYGTIMNELNEMDTVELIYLKASVQELTTRLWTEKQHRPMIAHLKDSIELDDFIRKHLFERNFYYNQATIKIDTDGYNISEITQKIVVTLF
ncbi:MAG: shikimate kinase [Patiriisocius sp.]|uniref:shikimate kinase n=1 Tax=Patiriisocius sp. TaxID=2822396 RepID=UPI003EF47121